MNALKKEILKVSIQPLSKGKGYFWLILNCKDFGIYELAGAFEVDSPVEAKNDFLEFAKINGFKKHRFID